MNEHVVAIEQLDERVAAHREVLETALGEDVGMAFQVDDSAGVGDSLVSVVARQVPDLAIADEDGHDQGNFPDRAWADCVHFPDRS